MTGQRFTSSSSLYTMSALLLTILGVSTGIQNCAVWKEITPCTCKIEHTLTTITCERMNSFSDIANILRNKFSPNDRMGLVIMSSSLYDLTESSFEDLNMKIENLKLNFVHLRDSETLSFTGLTNVVHLSLSDNNIPIMPINIFKSMPKVKTLDLGRIKLQYVPEDSFKGMPQLETLVLPTNHLSYVDSKSIPTTVKYLHIGRDTIRDLNGTLRELTQLRWLFMNANELTSIDGQLPQRADHLKMIHAAHNRIDRLPQEFKNYPELESLFFQHNLVTRFDGVFSKNKKIQRLQFEHNRLNLLTEDDFAEADNLEILLLGNNRLTSLNGSLESLRKLSHLNLTHNWFTEFSLSEVRGLSELAALDLSHNRLSRIIGLPPNLVEWETRICHLHLEHNELSTLNGSLSGLRNLLRLNLSHNKLTKILPDDLIGLDQLTMLDISYNQLTTLEETSKTFLPALEELIAHHNYLTLLHKDFHGLPVLCWADLSSNQIIALGRDLVSKTHCKEHGIHEDSWGTLKIYLQDNPILCDAALPEIIAELEVNHTRISGVSHCPPLSEQPVTSWPNAYLGYVPDLASQPSSVPGLIPTYIQSHVNKPYIYNEPMYQSVPSQQHTYIHDNIAANNLNNVNNPIGYGNDGVRIPNDPIRPPKIGEPYFVPVHQNQYHKNLNPQILQGENGNTKSNVLIPVQSLPYQSQNLNILNDRISIPLLSGTIQDQPVRHRSVEVENNQSFEVNEQNNSKQTQPVNDPTVFGSIDPLIQEEQLNQLATQIQELKTKVEELTNQNQLLAQNINQILPQQSQEKTDNNISENTRINTSLLLDETIMTSTEKPIRNLDEAQTLKNS